MFRLENTYSWLRDEIDFCAIAKVQVQAVNLVTQPAIGVFEPKHGGVQRYIDDVVQVLGGDAAAISLGTQFWANAPNHTNPLLVEFDELPHGICRTQQAGFGAGAQHANRSRAILLPLVKKSPVGDMKSGNVYVPGIDTVDGRHILLRLRNSLGRDETFAGRGCSQVTQIVQNDPVVLKGQAR